MDTIMLQVKKVAALTLAAMLADPLGLGVSCALAASVKGLEVGEDQIVIRSDGELRFNSFVTSNPPRLVVELLDAEYRAEKKLNGQGAVLKGVRGGQFSRKPKPISRVVLDLARVVPYQIEQTGKELLVRLGALGTEALKDVPGTLVAQAPEAGAVGTEPKLSEDMPSSPDLPAAAPAKSEAAQMKKAEDAKPAARRSYDIVDSMSGDPDDFHVDGVDIRDALRLLGEKAKINVVYGPDVSGTITLHLNQVPFRDIFRTVLNMQGLVTEQVGDKILRVMTPASYQASRQQAVPQTKVFSLNYAKAKDIQVQLDTIRGAEGRRGATVVDDTTNSVIVTDTAEGLDQTARLISQIDRVPRQVLIEAKLVEVELGKTDELGIRWSVAYQDRSKISGQNGVNYSGFGNAGDTFTDAAGVAQPFPFNANLPRGSGVLAPISGVPTAAIGFGRISNRFHLDGQLQALAERGKLRILSDPKVATLNNKKAEIKITTQIPFVTTSIAAGGSGSVQQSVGFTTTGITLTVTPTINADGHITLQVKPEVSRPGAREPVTGARGSNSRSTDTTVLVRNGETIVIGGLISDSQDESTKKVPLLGDIPVLGWLFKSKSSTRTRQELLVFVTTRIMS